MIKFTGTETNALTSRSHIGAFLKVICEAQRKTTERFERREKQGRWRNWSCNHLGETAPLFCCINLLFFPRSPAHSFDPLLDHPLDDSLTAKEIKYIRLTTLLSPLHLPRPLFSPLFGTTASLLPPSSLLLPEAFISSIDKQRICFLSLHLPSLSCLSCLPLSVFFFLFSVLCLIPTSRWMHVRDVIPLFNMFV